MFCLSWLITWYGHVLSDFKHIVRLYDFFMACHPLMPIYLAADVRRFCICLFIFSLMSFSVLVVLKVNLLAADVREFCIFLFRSLIVSSLFVVFDIN